MKTDWRTRTHEAWIEEIAKDEYDTIGVLKFDNGRYIKPKQALALYKAYWHKVDRTMFGRAADKGYGVKRWCFTELGKDGLNLHLHFAAASPFNVLPFCAVLNGLWSNFHKRTADYRFNSITPKMYGVDAAAYTSKSTKQFAYDTIGLAVKFQPNPNLRHDTFDIEAQTRRIANRLTEQQIEEAFKATNKHIEETKERRKQRQKKYAQRQSAA